jgi:hypothetical protein
MSAVENAIAFDEKNIVHWWYVLRAAKAKSVDGASSISDTICGHERSECPFSIRSRSSGSADR